MLPEEKPLSPAPAVELQLHTPTPQSRPHRHMSHSRFEPHRGTVARRQWHAFSWPETAQPGRVQEAMFHSSAVTGFSQHAKRDRHTHAHTRGKVERDPPSVSERRAGKVNVACVCTGLQMTDGAQVPLGRRTTASLGRATGKWWMLPSPSHIWNEIKTGKRGARCYVGCSEGSFVFHFKSVLSGHIKREGGASNVGNNIK